LRMGDTAFLGRPWLAGPPGAGLRLIRDCGEIERLTATLDSRAGRRNDRDAQSRRRLQ
jgi:hypothetical protein